MDFLRTMSSKSGFCRMPMSACRRQCTTSWQAITATCKHVNIMGHSPRNFHCYDLPPSSLCCGTALDFCVRLQPNASDHMLSWTDRRPQR